MDEPQYPEIAEMKARGYDPATIAEAIAAIEQHAKLRESAARIAPLIEAAFVGVTLGNGRGLYEAAALDDYADAATCAAYRTTDEKDDWHRIAAEDLNRCSASLSYLDAAGMRFHLPAFLLADLRGDCGMGMAFSLTHRSELFADRFSLLSPEQRLAVRAYLLHIADDPDYQCDRPEILRAINDYWTDPDPV